MVSSESTWSEGNMVVNAVVKGPTVSYGNGKRNYLRKGGEKRGFTQVTQIHV